MRVVPPPFLAALAAVLLLALVPLAHAKPLGDTPNGCEGIATNLSTDDGLVILGEWCIDPAGSPMKPVYPCAAPTRPAAPLALAGSALLP